MPLHIVPRIDVDATVPARGPIPDQYRALRYAQMLAEAEAVASVGSRGDSYAIAEALNSFYKAELIHLDRPWAGREEAEAATAEWMHWINTDRLHSMLYYNTPAETEAAYWAENEPAASAA